MHLRGRGVGWGASIQRGFTVKDLPFTMQLARAATMYREDSAAAYDGRLDE
jgi:hypothetical protein